MELVYTLSDSRGSRLEAQSAINGFGRKGRRREEGSCEGGKDMSQGFNPNSVRFTALTISAGHRTLAFSALKIVAAVRLRGVCVL